ncbi:DUF6777 domain-containing protein [Streptomyces sp. NPDC097941]|uniref:DUF6777 domain-containing protein n=1 Tax=Streptomyces sp. NPDC097941 TaxID=3155685 RepID=UPI00332E9A5B
MSVEPPTSGRPTGPPSGPLSGPSQPPSGPPSQPPGSSGGAPAPEPRRPWWRSAPRVAIIAGAVVVAVVLALVFTRSGGGSTAAGGNGEVFLQAAAKTGPDPFTESTAKDSTVPPVSATPTGSSSEPANAVRGVDGAAPGLYGGTRNVSSCDIEKQVKALGADPAKNSVFASVAGVQPSGVPAFLRSLTPVQLRMDTRVTNHGYRDGAATSYQAVLQAGTAVLVDDRGVPRTRCACGNPLTPPVAQQSTPKPTGDSWASYHPSNVVVVAPSTTVINIFVIYDPDHHDWVARHRGDTGSKDHRTHPPARPSPPVTVSPPTAPGTSTSPASPSPCVSTSSGAPTPSGSHRPCPPALVAPSSPPTSPPTSQPPSSESSREPLVPESSAPPAPLTSSTTPETTQSAPLSSATGSPAV